MLRRCSKNIHIQLPHLSQDIDFGSLIASEFMRTRMLVDNCGNPRIEFLPDPCVPLTGEEECDENPLITNIKGSVHVECNLTAGSMQVDNIGGNGCNLRNTDDTKIIGFEYDRENRAIVIQQQNSKVCGDEENEVERFELSAEDFTHNTVITDFDFGLVEAEDGEDNENLLTIIDSDNRRFTVDLSKYCNRSERYVAPGSYRATSGGIITLPYNIETDEQVIIDISDAVHGFKDIEFDKCSGVLSVTTDKENVVSIGGFPTNISLDGYVNSNNFSGSIYYTISNNIITVNFDIVVNVFVGGISTLGYLPIRLKNRTFVWLTSMHGTSYSRLNRVQITISTDGELQLRQWQIPERVQDSFTIIFDSLDPDVLRELCDNQDNQQN